MSFKKITGNNRLNKKDDNGVDCLVYITHFMESEVRSERNGQTRTFKVTAGTTMFLENIGIKLAKPKPSEPPLEDNTPLAYPAFTNGHYVKMFDTAMKDFVPMRVYQAVGLVRTRYSKDGEVRESLNVAQLRPTNQSIYDFLPIIPFDNRRFHPERDFIISLQEVGAFVIDLKHKSDAVQKDTPLTKEDEWFHDQPQDTIWGATMLTDVDATTGFRFAEKDGEGKDLPFEDGIVARGGGEKGEPIHVYARQKNADGTAFTVDVSVRLGANSCANFQTREWQRVGASMLEHLEGSLVCSTFIKSTATLKNPDVETFDYYMQVNGDLVPNVGAMVKNAGFSVSRAVATQVMKTYAAAEKLEDNFKDVNAWNLCGVNFSMNKIEELLNPETNDYYIVGNWLDQQARHIDEMESDEEIIGALCDVKPKSKFFWPKGEPPVVNVYAVPKETNKRIKLETNSE